MRDELAIIMHRDGWCKSVPAISRAQQADVAGIGFGQRLRVADDHRAVGAKAHRGAALAVCGNDIVTGVQHLPWLPGLPVIRCGLYEQSRMVIQAGNPQCALGIGSNAQRQGGACIAVGHLRCGGQERPQHSRQSPETRLAGVHVTSSPVQGADVNPVAAYAAQTASG